MKTINARKLSWAICCLLVLATLVSLGNAQIDYGPQLVNSLAWSPDGTKYAVGRGTPVCNPNDKSAFGVEIRDTKTSTVVKSLFGHSCPVSSLAWSPDGTQLASGSDVLGEPIYIWDVEKGSQVQVKGINALGSGSLSWHPDGSLLAAVILPRGPSGAGYIWNTSSWELITREPFDGAPPIAISHLGWSPDGRFIATTREVGGVINIWNTQGLTLHKSLSVRHTDTTPSVEDNVISWLDWSPDSKRIATSDYAGNIVITDINNGSSVRLSSPNRIIEITWSPDGTRLAVVKPDDGVEIWDVAESQLLETLAYDGRVYTVAWSPDSTQLIYGGWASEGDAEAVIVVPASSPRSITGFVLVDADADEDIRPLADGDTITEETITIRVETEPPIVGSVVFGLNEEPRFKVENEAAYALKGDDNGDYHAWLAEPGTYTLTATPYTEADGQGEAGTPLTITFTVAEPGS